MATTRTASLISDVLTLETRLVSAESGGPEVAAASLAGQPDALNFIVRGIESALTKALCACYIAGITESMIYGEI
jgi:hypothetical protein